MAAQAASKEETLLEAFLRVIGTRNGASEAHPYVIVYALKKERPVPNIWATDQELSLQDARSALETVSINGAGLPRTLEPFQGSGFAELFRPVTECAAGDEDDQLI